MEILYYFDAIPSELNNLILHNIEKDDLIKDDLIKITIHGTEIESIDKILNSLEFWNYHVRLFFPDVPFEYVPEYMYNYNKLDIISIVENYSMFTFCYSLAKGRMKFTPTEEYKFFGPHPFRVASITNNKILVDILSPHFGSTAQLYDFITNRWRNVIIEIGNGTPKFVFENRRFEITYRQAFGLFLHFICNNHYEIAI